MKQSHVNCEQWGTHKAGALSVLTSFTLSMTAASNLARVITDVSFEATTAADNGSGQTSVEHIDTSVSCQSSYTVTSYIATQTIIRVTHTRFWYQKLALMHMTKIVQFDRSTVFESFWFQKHRTALHSIWCKFLVPDSWLCVTHINVCLSYSIQRQAKHLTMILTFVLVAEGHIYNKYECTIDQQLTYSAA